MDNQHRKISGYRELDEGEIALMNEIKALGPQLEAMCTKVASCGGEPRWTAIGKTHLQQGLMALTRAVAQPEFF